MSDCLDELEMFSMDASNGHGAVLAQWAFNEISHLRMRVSQVADRVAQEAALAARPGQLASLEGIAQELRDLASPSPRRPEQKD